MEDWDAFEGIELPSSEGSAVLGCAVETPPIRDLAIVDSLVVDGSDAVDSVDNKRFHGCLRAAGRTSCWCIAGDTPEWALPNSRGLWCKDCLCVWRHIWSRECTLAMLSVHLQVPSHRRRFSIGLTAYLAMKREGIIRITAAALSERVASLEFAMQ